ncbi:hypothetical protein SEVIR_9G201900v4 [Setaria viridis]|uniref:Bowman-Birk serine protease inhibitors family domain-containing protein n=2 Tax=Setaria TaxID=4554 RepID=K4AGV5_SETIT|nr:Bowman-Birk type trypsin inhibitor [Setaria italica]XP_034576958.1 Bowman-Birk type trypsin inhibitor-like [Setaria viridis]RCV42271.1 hypothetical protein SETIT_9G203400v2 [Setaria italica]TKV93065.1 hypothetical protein SEVIR_9G201900v2 [Setaria viridis]
MRPKMLLVTLAVVAVLAALPLGKGHGGEEGGGAAPGNDANARAWPCCDTCGVCTRSLPPICSCRDLSPGGCHPACRNCLQSTTGGVRGAPLFQCTDFITNFCKRRCTPAAAGA